LSYELLEKIELDELLDAVASLLRMLEHGEENIEFTHKLWYSSAMLYQDQAIAVILTALYLPGLRSAPPLPRSRWLRIDALLRSKAAASGNAGNLLSQAGFWLEGSALGEPGLLARAESIVASGKALTAASPLYPAKWLRLLGQGAPPVLWCQGEMPAGPYFTVVGSRYPPLPAWRFAAAAAKAILARGVSLASGGARGIDRAAASASSALASARMVEILPHGLERIAAAPWCRLSLGRPHDEFSSALAMERNVLLYALSDRALVVAPRLRQGGAWIGACECLRRRLSLLHVYDDASPASRALVGLGAKPVLSPEQLFETQPDHIQGELALNAPSECPSRIRPS